jgi:hypothetical protein
VRALPRVITFAFLTVIFWSVFNESSAHGMTGRLFLYLKHGEPANAELPRILASKKILKPQHSEEPESDLIFFEHIGSFITTHPCSWWSKDRAAGEGVTEGLESGTAMKPPCGDDG